MKTKTLSFGSPAVLFATLLAILPLKANANTIALDYGTAGFGNPVAGFTVGWEFTVSSAVTVTDLGIWDMSNTGNPFTNIGDGLQAPHTVTIWTSAMAPVATAVVPAGTVGTLDNEFRFTSIAPTALLPGSYVIGAYYPDSNDQFVVDGAMGITTVSQISYDGGKITAGNGFPATDRPDNGLNDGMFGPNFKILDQATNGVPEGGGTLLLMFGSLGALLIVRRWCQASVKI